MPPASWPWTAHSFGRCSAQVGGPGAPKANDAPSTASLTRDISVPIGRRCVSLRQHTKRGYTCAATPTPGGSLSGYRLSANDVARVAPTRRGKAGVEFKTAGDVTT